jgi:hypothetical protein
VTRNPEEIPLLFPAPVIEAYLKDVDRTLIRSMLQNTATQRVDCVRQLNLMVQSMRRQRDSERAARG